MIANRTNSLMNLVIDNTANSMSQTIYQNSMATISMYGVNKGYNTVENTQNARGLSMGIVCGKSVCGSERNPTGEVCKYI